MARAEPRHIVIAGNIGVGKSTLVTLLAETCGWTPVYELEAAHPYLADYYADPQRWGFHSQVWFLTQRLIQHQQIAGLPEMVVQDRSLYEDAAVFAASLHARASSPSATTRPTSSSTPPSPVSCARRTWSSSCGRACLPCSHGSPGAPGRQSWPSSPAISPAWSATTRPGSPGGRPAPY